MIESSQEVDVGLAADIGTLQRFPKTVGSESIARELALSGRKFGAKEAERIGFISRIVPGGKDAVEAEALKLAALIASKSPVAVWGTKNVMNCEWCRTGLLETRRIIDSPLFPDSRDHS